MTPEWRWRLERPWEYSRAERLDRLDFSGARTLTADAKAALAHIDALTARVAELEAVSLAATQNWLTTQRLGAEAVDRADALTAERDALAGCDGQCTCVVWTSRHEAAMALYDEVGKRKQAERTVAELREALAFYADENRWREAEYDSYTFRYLNREQPWDIAKVALAPWYAGGTARTCDACKVEDLTDENAALRRENAALREALIDMRAGWAFDPDYGMEEIMVTIDAALAPTKEDA